MTTCEHDFILLHLSSASAKSEQTYHLLSLLVQHDLNDFRICLVNQESKKNEQGIFGSIMRLGYAFNHEIQITVKSHPLDHPSMSSYVCWFKHSLFPTKIDQARLKDAT